MAAVTELFRQWLEGKQKKSGLTLTQFAKNVGGGGWCCGVAHVILSIGCLS
jgi:hypothetical protein